ncbi:glycosyltransferase family 39 protein, partial [bacterium]|nr:glycosyltransferase family 39 protein [candidate division CSSED10-310 bacterium]
MSRSAAATAGIGIWLVCSGAFLMLGGGHIYVQDGGGMFFMSDSLLSHGWFDVPLNHNTMGGKYGPDGRYYTPFGILHPLLAVPFLMLGRCLEGLAGARYLPSLTATWFNAVATATLCTIFFLFLLRLRVPLRAALAGGLSLAFTTPFLVYARTFFSEPLTALAILASAYHLRLFRDCGRLYHLAAAGIWAAAALLTRPLAGMALPVLFLYLVLILARTTPTSRSQVRAVLLFATICVAAVGLLLVYNHARYGDILQTGYDKLPDGRPRSFTLNPFYGLAVLLVSPGKSLFLFAPLALAALWGLWRWRKDAAAHPELVLAAVMPALFIAVLCRWARVEGGVCWGPRLLLPALPVLLLGLAPLLAAPTRRMVAFLLLLAAAGLFVQFTGAAINFATYVATHSDEYFHPTTGVYRFRFN